MQDWRAHGGLNALVALAFSGAVPPAKVLDDIAVMRAALGADAYPVLPVAADELTLVDLAFWTAVVDGCHNVAYWLGLNTLVAGIVEIGHGRIDGLLEEYADRDAHLELARLIGTRDGAAARTHAERLLARP